MHKLVVCDGCEAICAPLRGCAASETVQLWISDKNSKGQKSIEIETTYA